MSEGTQKARRGEVAEWSNAAVLKTVELKGSGGSNPSLSAIFGSDPPIEPFPEKLNLII